jgi:hypothetical protein
VQERALDRLGWLLLALGADALLVTARLLTPAESGLGTHTQLGLPPCGFLLLFGKPCPACGLTTAFAQLARLELAASLRANPVGLPLFLATVALFACALRGWLGGVHLRGWLARPQLLPAALTLCLALLAVWLVRLIF